MILVILIFLIVILGILNYNKNLYFIYVLIDDSRLYVFKEGILYKLYFILFGKFLIFILVGIFKIILKDYWGEGFGGRWMGLNV